MTFAACLPIILEAEGGYSNRPDDAGGPTNLGITLATLSQYLGEQASIGSIQALTPETVAPIYEQLYWNKVGCDVAPNGLDLILFDGAVNQGQPTVVEMVQAIFGLIVDGAAGPNTRKALEACDTSSTIDQLYTARKERYLSSRGFGTFGDGWISRLDRIHALAHQMADAQ